MILSAAQGRVLQGDVPGGVAPLPAVEVGLVPDLVLGDPGRPIL